VSLHRAFLSRFSVRRERIGVLITDKMPLDRAVTDAVSASSQKKARRELLIVGRDCCELRTLDIRYEDDNALHSLVARLATSQHPLQMLLTF
jgi:hypothetical protein